MFQSFIKLMPCMTCFFSVNYQKSYHIFFTRNDLSNTKHCSMVCISIVPWWSFLRISSKVCVHDYVYRLEKGILTLQSQIKMYLCVFVVYDVACTYTPFLCAQTLYKTKKWNICGVKHWKIILIRWYAQFSRI